MARVSLQTWPAFGVRYRHPSDRPGTTTLLPTYHLAIPLFVAPTGSPPNWRPADPADSIRTFDAILDTGAPLTVIPYAVWQVFAADVQIFAQPAADAAMQIAGGSQRGQLGRFRLGAIDDARRWLPAEWTLAIFLDEPAEADAATSLQMPLVGLNAHFFAHNRRLRHVGFSEGEGLAAVPEWRLEDRSRLMPW